MSNIHDLLDRYWQLAYAEGRENRQHDTENGDAQECRSAIEGEIERLRKALEPFAVEAPAHLKDEDSFQLWTDTGSIRAALDAIKEG